MSIQSFLIVTPVQHIGLANLAKAALMYDAAQVLVDAILRLVRKKPDILRGLTRRNANLNSNNTLDCNPQEKYSAYEIGDRIFRMTKKTELEGLTGFPKFEAGHRRNFTLQLMEMTISGDMVKIGTWYDYKMLVPIVAKPAIKIPGHYDRNKTYIVLTVEEAHYIMRFDPELMANYPYLAFASISPNCCWKR
ncbi:unnamed protein product [Parnassius apollo]|uniref:(apollo) hypothetical protein n=1 Tax=Parnassius apollo TaxID=110799 RepID=A0A8S3XVG4_PARAO|nr:unnamed protein product [Parnassius apollo]